MEHAVEGILYFVSIVFVPFDLFTGEELILTSVFLFQLFYYKRIRWQLVPLYTALSIATLVFLSELIFSTSGPSKYLILFETILIVLSFLVNISLPSVALPKPSGYSIGTVTATISNIRVKFWYPAERVDGYNRAPLIPQGYTAPFIHKGISSKFPGFILSHLEITQTNAYERPPVNNSQNKWPLIFLSHGFYGFAPEHTDGSCPHNLVTLPPGFDTNDEKSAYDLCSGLLEIRMQDLDNVLTCLIGDKTTNFEFLRKRINIDKLAVYGHSFGACTAIQFLKRNELIKCGISLDAWVLPLSPAERQMPCNKSLFFIKSERNTSFELDHPKWVETVCRSFSDAHLFTLMGALHHNFNDISLYAPALNYIMQKFSLIGPIDGAYALDICINTSLRFLDHTLINGKFIKNEDLLMYRELVPTYY